VTGIVIADSSPLIALERIGRLDVLPALFGTVVVPPAVAREIAAKGLLSDWMIVRPLPDPLDVRLAESTLDAGEREAIGLALQTNVDRLILDDESARRVALRFGLPVTGTLGVLILAKRTGIVDAVRPLLDALAAAEFRIDRRLRAWVLTTAGEED
jgi:predicted nucleic acid-binding protein